MDIRTESAWVCVARHGTPRPYIHEGAVKRTRQHSQQSIGKAFAREGETAQQGWRRAYRMGWRCVRCTISVAADLTE